MSRIIDAALEAIDRVLCPDGCDDNALHGSNTEDEMDVTDGDDLSDS